MADGELKVFLGDLSRYDKPVALRKINGKALYLKRLQREIQEDLIQLKKYKYVIKANRKFGRG